MCHVRGTIKINKHKQSGCTLKKRLLLAANYNTMISHPLPRVFSFFTIWRRQEKRIQVFSLTGHRHIGKREGTQGKDVLWEMCKWRILFTSTQEPQLEIIDSVTHFRSTILVENIYQFCMRIQNEGVIPRSHIFPKATFVLGSFRAILSSHFNFLLSFQTT